MKIIDTDILVAGGGIAGLSATARLASAGFDVTCVDPVSYTHLTLPTTPYV